ncbi:MAG TPA: glycosyltransferase [Polyangiaceae bacterium]|jgi:glycosyltransferase involved in cell wall biosynthesis|nr:glycosyltransferase [Polyangiaceae bacterium]
MRSEVSGMRALIVSYAFPPVGGAGVQRVLKLVKYLPRHGVTASVLTARDPSVPVLDASLERDVPPGTEVLRVRTLEPRYGAKKLAWQASANLSGSVVSRLKGNAVGLGRRLLVPDPQVLWLPAAHWALARRLRSERPDDVVFISGPPFSQFLLSALVSLSPRTAIVLDYRDEWSTTSSAFEMSGSARISARLEHAVLRRAHAVTTATDEFRTALLARFPFLDPSRVTAIPNGYDPEDFVPGLPSPAANRFTLTYAGTVFRLTSASGLVEGVRLLHEREPELARLLEIRFVGRIVDTEVRYFEGSEALGIRRLGYLDHAQAVEQLAESHAVLCILDEVSGVERIYPAKIFEIMQLGRPCLALTPEGALATLVRRHRAGEVIAPRDSEAIASALSRMLRGFRDGTTALFAPPIDIERFDRRLQAGQFADVFRTAVDRARHRLTNGTQHYPAAT